VTRIAVNHAIDVKRKKEKMKAQSLDEAGYELLPANENTEEFILKKELKEKVGMRLCEMPQNYQDVINAYYIREKSYKEIASELQIEVTTVKMKLYRARNWMKKHWDEGDFR
jgi:RNA polymerase sigma factor (sigma-70 family)